MDAPTREYLAGLLGNSAFSMYEKMDAYILDHYNVDLLWSKGGKYGDICLRYSRSGRTLCTMYFSQQELDVWIILGREERIVFRENRECFQEEVLAFYDATKVYHDGKWLTFHLKDDKLFSDLTRLLYIKKRPNRKFTMCGFCCDMCKAYIKNIRKKDERKELSWLWKKYYNLDVPPEAMICDGCRCTRKDARLIDPSCPVRACVLERKLNDCSECGQFPCKIFQGRRGLCYEEAAQNADFNVEEYYDYLMAFDNGTRLERKRERE